MKFNNVTGTEDKFIIRLLNPGTEGRLESSQTKTHCKRKHKTKAVGGFWPEAMQVGDGGRGAGAPRRQKKTGRNPANPARHTEGDALERPREAKPFPDTQKLQRPLRGLGLSDWHNDWHTGQDGSEDARSGGPRTPPLRHGPRKHAPRLRSSDAKQTIACPGGGRRGGGDAGRGDG